MDSLHPRPPELPTVHLTRDRGSDAIAAAVRGGLLVRVRRGAYVAPTTAKEPWARRRWMELARCAALSRQLGPEVVFTHATAAMLHGCWLWDSKPVAHLMHVGRSWSPSNSRSTDIRRHRPSLEPRDIVMVKGLRVASLERTVIDCALTMHPRDALVVADSGLKLLTRADRWHRDEAAERVQLVREALKSRLADLGRHRGVRQARAVIEHADPFPDSPPESVLRWIAVSGGLPRPVTQLRLDIGGRTYFSDLGWIFDLRSRVDSTRRRYRIHAEYDGLVKYDGISAGHAVVAEKAREDAIRESGDTFRRFIDLRDEEAVFRRLCTAFPSAVLQNLRPVPELQAPLTGADGVPFR